MVRQSEFKPRFDPELGRYAMKHIHGEGIMDVFQISWIKTFRKNSKRISLRKEPKLQLKKQSPKLVSLLVIKQVIK